MTPEQNVKNLEIQLDQLFRQCDIMFTIFSRNSYLLTETRLEQTKERHDALKAQVCTKNRQKSFGIFENSQKTKNVNLLEIDKA